MSAGRRVVVTGLGVVSSLGCDVPAFWKGCLAGRGPVAAVPAAWGRAGPLRSRVWAPLGAWERDTQLLGRAEPRRLDTTSRMALLAAEEALAAAGLALVETDRKRRAFRLEGIDPAACGVFVGTGIGGIGSVLASAAYVMVAPAKQALGALAADLSEGEGATLVATLQELPAPAVFNPFSVAMSMPNAVAANLALKLGLRGPCPTFACACASGTVALGRAFRAVRDGDCDAALVAGTEHLADPYGCVFRGFDAVGALAQGELPAERLNRPFDEARSGFLFAEGGAAALWLEEREAARARGASVLAEVVGYAETCDAHDIMAVEPSGREIRRAIELCLADAGIAPRDVGLLNAHGTGTPLNDPVEAAVLGELFGDGVPISATKSLLGHTLGASGALEAVATVLSLLHGRAHPCRNLERPVAGLSFVREDAPLVARHALSQSFAFGGQNAVVAFAAA